MSRDASDWDKFDQNTIVQDNSTQVSTVSIAFVSGLWMVLPGHEQVRHSNGRQFTERPWKTEADLGKDGETQDETGKN